MLRHILDRLSAKYAGKRISSVERVAVPLCGIDRKVNKPFQGPTIMKINEAQLSLPRSSTARDIIITPNHSDTKAASNMAKALFQLLLKLSFR